jgi:hypothetical protein
MSVRALVPLALAGCDASAPLGPTPAEDPAPIVAVTFNTGTTDGLAHDDPPDDGYTSAEAAISDEHYGDGLAWVAAIDAAAAWLAEVRPDVIGFQEIFHPGHCPDIPADAYPGFVCEGWVEGDPTVAQRILVGDGYQVACHPGHTDKCIGVRRDFATIRGCDADLCLEGLGGAEVEGCGSGARVARGTLDLSDGSALTVVNFHGTSGISLEEQACRARQVEQVFVDLGDGAPAANGEKNLILGDLNTDPGRWAEVEDSAARWADFVGGDLAFQWVTEAGPDAPLTYGGLATIDHVASDAFAGNCWHPGLSEGHPAVFDAIYFDHRPAVCALLPR